MSLSFGDVWGSLIFWTSSWLTHPKRIALRPESYPSLLSKGRVHRFHCSCFWAAQVAKYWLENFIKYLLKLDIGDRAAGHRGDRLIGGFRQLIVFSSSRSGQLLAEASGHKFALSIDHQQLKADSSNTASDI